MNLTKVDQLEKFLVGLPQVVCDCIHAFGPGIYIRHVDLKAGSFVMGHRHKQAHLNIMLKGRMTLFHDNGVREELIAPVICIAQPGRKIAYIHEDSTWLNLYATNETDVEKLEEEFLDKTPSLDEVNVMRHRDEDREDFEKFLWESGLSEEYVRCESEQTIDQIPFPLGLYKCVIGTSMIEGKGLLATSYIEAGECIAPARLDGKRTPAGRYTNHSKNANAKFIAEGSDIYLISLCPIFGCMGGLAGEEITVNYRDSLALNQSIPI